MSFWESELGEVTGKSEDAFAKSGFVLVPNGTMALAKIDSFANAEYNGSRYISIDWILTAGDFAGAKVNQKLRVYEPASYDKDPAKTRHRALNMLKLIYQLFSVKPTHSNDPTDSDLAVFVGKQAGIQIRETEQNDAGKQYNWVSEIHSAKGFKCETGTTLVITHKNQSSAKEPVDSALTRQGRLPTDTDLDDDIPF